MLCDLTAIWADVQLHYHERNTFIVLFMRTEQGLLRQYQRIVLNVISLSYAVEFNIQRHFERCICLTYRVGYTT